MSAKIVPFAKVKRKAYDLASTQEEREYLSDMLMRRAIEAENGELSELCMAIVYRDGDEDSAYMTPRQSTRMLKAIGNLKTRVLEKLEEEGSR